MSENIGGISVDDILSFAMDGFESDIESKEETTVDEILKKSADEEALAKEISEESEKFENFISQKKQPVIDCDLNTFVNNSFALNLISRSYNDLKNDIAEESKIWFDSAVKSMVYELFPNGITYECDENIKCSVPVDTELLNLLTFGHYEKHKNSEQHSEIFEIAKLHTLKNVIEYPIVIDDKKAFNLNITTDKKSRSKAERFIQYLIYSVAANADKGNVHFRCADKEKGGQSYGKFISLIGHNKFFGNGVYNDDSTIRDMISDLNKIVSDNFDKLKGMYNSVYDYNHANNKKIPVTLAIFCDVSKLSYSNEVDQLKKIINNSQNAAISTIFLTDIEEKPILNEFNNQINISFENDDVFLINSNYRVPLNIDSALFSDEQFSLLEEKLNSIEKVDTDFKTHYDLNNLQLFTRDATEGLQIPFAFDENNNFVDLEIGDVTPHALLSGSTGSGKSVALHAIINQTMINYHPADVEIWAIDYKAVEFGCYVNNRTPHITVIGQDNSDDFTFGLIDLVKSEYERRKELFVQNNCKDFKAYRHAYGKRSLSRILIVVDEFHNMTQAISGYMGEKDYKKILENLLSEMRAMGMSFLFCSQTIASGLNGLTEKGRNQIGCRLSMRHEDINEIKETLSLSLTSGVDFESIKYLRQGQMIYKKICKKNDAEPYSLEKVNVLYTELYRDFIIDKINANIESNYVPREEIICKNSNRYHISEKKRHPVMKFMDTGRSVNHDLLTVYPGAPTSLKESFYFELVAESGNNILLVGENDSMRESIVVSSILGLLIDSQNTVVASILDTEDCNNQRLYDHLKKINSDRLQINYGFDDVMCCIDSLKKLKPYKNGRIIYLWYGLNKLKNLIFLHSQEEEDKEFEKQDDTGVPDFIPDGVSPLDFLNNALEMIENQGLKQPERQTFDGKLNYEDCRKIINKLEEFGAENNRYCFTVFNTFKGMKKTKICNVDNYEYRIGLKMSVDDSYDLFGSTSFISKANDKTAVVYSGNKIAKTIRPYLLPDDFFINKFNKILEG